MVDIYYPSYAYVLAYKSFFLSYILLNIYIGKHEFEVKSDAKPHVNGTKQKKTSDQIKNEKDVSDQDDEESSESESDSDEDSGEEKVSA